MKRACYAGLWLAIFAMFLMGLNALLMREDAQNKYSAFMEETGDIDVFFLGTSHMMDAVYPIELWRDYGFTSYNLGNPAETLEATAWTLKLANAVHHPRVAVIDVCYIGKSQAESGNAALAHTFMDAIPLSRLKLEAIWSLFPKGKRAGLVFPLVEYHTRWEELLLGTQQDTADCMPCMRGAELRAGRVAGAPFERTTQMDERETAGKDALRKMIDYCRARGIEPVLVCIPYPAPQDTQMLMNSAQEIADAYDVPFLNLFDVEGLVDFSVDCYDEASHLNPDGAAKVTAYLGQWLMDTYDLEDRRGQADYAHWDEALDLYEAVYEEAWGADTLL